MRILYLDCFCGVSGDMVVGALVDAGADFETIRRGLASLPLEGLEVSVDKVNKNGLMATQFCVRVAEDHEQPARGLGDVLDILERGGLPDAVKTASALTFRRLAECEAAIHGSTPEAIHFHEVGAVDAIADIVAAHWAREDLGVERVVVSPLPVGRGTVACAHGVLPVPAPATAALLEGAPCYGGDVEGECVTPTGAALVSQWADAYGPMPPMRPEAIGYGCGTRDLPDRANVLRAFVGEAEEPLAGTEPIVVVEANVDDMTPELLAPLVEECLVACARDAFVTPIVGKKGRPGHLITVLCDDMHLAALVDVFFRHSTTFGVRIRDERRICLQREWKSVATPWGPVRVKVGAFGAEQRRVAPEFEDCRAVAGRAGVPVLDVYEQALAAAVKGEFDHD